MRPPPPPPPPPRLELLLADELHCLRRVAALVLVVFCVYTGAYGKAEMHWDATDIVFMASQTLTTVGYGNLTPKNDFQVGDDGRILPRRRPKHEPRRTAPLPRRPMLFTAS